MKMPSSSIVSSNRSRIAIFSVVMAVGLSPALAQDSLVPAPPLLPSQVRVGPAVMDAPFNDPGNATAKALAAEAGISVGQAMSQLRHATNASRAARKFEERFPDRFAGIVIESQSGEPKAVLYRTGTEALGGVDVDSDFASSLEQRQVSLSRGQIKKLGKDLITALGRLGIVADIAVSAPLNKIRVLARNPAEVETAVAQGKIILPEIAVIEQFDGIVTTAVSNIGGGYAANTTSQGCTVGFTITITALAQRGTTTAGHCDNAMKVSDNYSTTYSSSGQASTTYKAQMIAPASADYGIDLQWHTATATPIPQFWNGSSWIGVTGGKDDLAGEYVCKFGRTTQQTCGYIDPYEYYDSNFKGYFPRVNRGTGPQLNIEGDSGGPVYQGSLAVGWVHGRDASYNMYYTPLRNITANGAGITVLTIYP